MKNQTNAMQTKQKLGVGVSFFWLYADGIGLGEFFFSFFLGCLPAPDEEDFGLEICVFFVDHVWCRIRLDARN